MSSGIEPVARPAGAFGYRALEPSGRRVRGELIARSREQAVERLAAQGLLVLAVSPRQHVRGRSVPPDDVAQGLRLLASLLEAGLPVARTLDALADVAPRSWSRGVIESIELGVREGDSLAASLTTSGLPLSPAVRGVLLAAERSGALVEGLQGAAEDIERNAALRDSLRAALAYPAFLLLATLVAAGLLAGVVLPRFGELLMDLGAPLPWSTRALLGLGDLVQRSAPSAAIALLGSAVAGTLWARRSAAIRRRLALALESIPVVGAARRAYVGARAATAMSTSLRCGVKIAVALEHAAEASGDVLARERLRQVQLAVIAGERLSSAVDQSGALPAGSAALLRAGEIRGDLATPLGQIAALASQRAQSLVTRAVRGLEPTLILALGAWVAFIAAALLQAIYSVRPAV